MDADKKQQTIRRIILAVASIVVFSLVVHVARLYAKTVWNNLHLVNFVVAWIPAVLSILVAFIPDKDLEKRVRVGWRVSVIACGLLYSVFLWHQQTLTDSMNADSQTKAVNDAVDKANLHSDQQFSKIQGKVGDLDGEVRGVNDQLRSNSAALGQSLGDINTNIGRVGRTDPPELAKLQFSLWSSSEFPLLSKTVQSDADGNYPIDFSFANLGGVTAEAIDVWVTICNVCTFAREPLGFEKPDGMDDHTRHYKFGDLNPGVSMKKMTAVVTLPPSFQSFTFSTHYACKNCGKIKPPVLATIFPLSQIRIPSAKFPTARLR
jgi:hypothetical protein